MVLRTRIWSLTLKDTAQMSRSRFGNIAALPDLNEIGLVTTVTS